LAATLNVPPAISAAMATQRKNVGFIIIVLQVKGSIFPA
jgi:hypothetical protein